MVDYDNDTKTGPDAWIGLQVFDYTFFEVLEDLPHKKGGGTKATGWTLYVPEWIDRVFRVATRTQFYTARITPKGEVCSTVEPFNSESVRTVLLQMYENEKLRATVMAMIRLGACLEDVVNVIEDKCA